jgi:hypothetical protein
MADRTTERKPPDATLVPAQLFQFGKERTDAMLNVQRELLEAYENAGRVWLTRMETELKLWNGFAVNLAASRTLPEGMKVYGDCIAQRMQMVAEDGQHLFDDAQKLMTTITGSFNGQRTKLQ